MRYLITGIIVFLAWSGLCGWWYICRIQGYCASGEPVKVSISGDSLQGSDSLSGKEELPAPLPEELKGVHKIFFSYARPILTNQDEALEFIRDASAYLKQNPAKKIYLTGYTDDMAAKPQNLELGMKRARTVEAMFISQGVPESQLVTSSKGEANPIGDNNTPDGRNKNRRVEIFLNE